MASADITKSDLAAMFFIREPGPKWQDVVVARVVQTSGRIEKAEKEVIKRAKGDITAGNRAPLRLMEMDDGSDIDMDPRKSHFTYSGLE